MIGPKPTGLYALRPVLSNGTIPGRETITSMQRRVSAQATVAGVNADMFTWADERPSGIHMQDRVLAAPPHDSRSSVGITADGQLNDARVAFVGTWLGLGQRRADTGLTQ